MKNKNTKIFLLILLIVLSIFSISCSSGEKITADKDTKQYDSAETVAEQQNGSDAASDESPEKNAAQTDYLILVNDTHPISDDWEKSIELVQLTNSVGDDVRIERATYDAYLKLKDALESEDIYVEIDSAFRSIEEQQKIIDEFTEKYGYAYAHSYATEPGYSEHHTGLAVDLYLIVDGVTVYENEDLMRYPEIWKVIHEKLPEYGFILRYPQGNSIGVPYEPWHIRYVGTDAAREIFEDNITLEEYLRKNG